ncbi:leucine-rich repeat protein [Butyrivibrio sp. FC2001]|uniref:leucine-rich repeat protein n=1 Tax=Butyrivibrio sp. FC2001 TaxID=1280671 RepID=UPI0003F6BBD9|nr:leucine-rich repeat protein [Butyrivibrio sp. FC2001]
MKKSFKTGVCKALTTVACAALMIAGALGFGSMSAKAAATTKNVTIDYRNGRTISFNTEKEEENLNDNKISKDYLDSYITSVVMVCYDPSVRDLDITTTNQITSVLSKNPYQGITLTNSSDNSITMRAADGSVGTGKYVLNKEIIKQAADTFRLDKDNLDESAMEFMTVIDAMYSGDILTYYETHNVPEDIEYVVEIKFSDIPVKTDNKVNSTPAVTFEVGSEFEDNGIKYRIMDAEGNLSAISLTANSKSVTIPDSVNYSGIALNVTDIAQNFMKGNKKVKKVTIGSNVTSIGSKAFYQCKKLKKATIKSTKLTTIGKKAFGKDAKSFTLKMPKSCKKAYKKLLKKAKIKF